MRGIEDQLNHVSKVWGIKMWYDMLAVRLISLIFEQANSKETWHTCNMEGAGCL